VSNTSRIKTHKSKQYYNGLGKTESRQVVNTMEFPREYTIENRFSEVCGISIDFLSPERCEASFKVTEGLLQIAGFLHGGATIALLETAASSAAFARIDPKKELCFGLEANIRHRKPGSLGSKITGVATVNQVDGSRTVWDVIATDDSGDTISEGTFTTKSVTPERLAQKEQKRRARD
jgi:1,4-dihydroxy-2-naphthoyl-CoA hydrolase